MKILSIYYSMYGHIHRMAGSVAEGAKALKALMFLCIVSLRLSPMEY